MKHPRGGGQEVFSLGAKEGGGEEGCKTILSLKAEDSLAGKFELIIPVLQSWSILRDADKLPSTCFKWDSSAFAFCFGDDSFVQSQ